MGKDAKVHLVPNLGRKLEPHEPVPIGKKPGELRLVSVGRIAPEKNTLFAIERLRGLQGDIRFDLYGTVYDQAYWKLCEDAIAQLPPNVKVLWHDHIGEDHVRGVIEQAHAVLMPSVGENFGHTMLEALVAGRPLLISDRTPWKGLLAKTAGWDIPLEEPAWFEEVLEHLAALQQQDWERLCKGAATVAAQYVNDAGPATRSLAMFGR